MEKACCMVNVSSLRSRILAVIGSFFFNVSTGSSFDLQNADYQYLDCLYWKAATDFYCFFKAIIFCCLHFAHLLSETLLAVLLSG